MKKERIDNQIQPIIKNKNQIQNENHSLSYDKTLKLVNNSHAQSHWYENIQKQNQTSREDNRRQYQNQNVQSNRFQQRDSNIDYEINYENDFENQEISEYSLESIRREDRIEDRINKHILHKSIHFYLNHLHKNKKRIKIRTRTRKTRYIYEFIKCFQLIKIQNIKYVIQLQQEGQAEYFKDVEYEKIIRRHKKLIQRDTMKDPYYVRLVKLSEFERLNYELQKYNDNLTFLYIRKYLLFSYIAFQYQQGRQQTNYFLKLNDLSHLIQFVETNGRIDTDQIEEVVMILFISVIGLRIVASGIFFNDYAFFRNMQNIYDFILIFFTAMNIYYPEVIITDVSPLRLVTLLMYLTNIFQGLNVMLTALKQSFKYLIEALMIVILFCLIFASMGIILFQGLFNYRCQFENGDETEGWVQCHEDRCPDDMI